MQFPPGMEEEFKKHLPADIDEQYKKLQPPASCAASYVCEECQFFGCGWSNGACAGSHTPVKQAKLDIMNLMKAGLQCQSMDGMPKMSDRIQFFD
jgi:hypothetical protein